jgi:hypothetical protein
MWWCFVILNQMNLNLVQTDGKLKNLIRPQEGLKGWGMGVGHPL